VRISLYHEPWGGALGGGEVVAAVMASVLRERGDVVLWHHFPDLTRDELARFAGADLSGLEVKFVPRPARGWQAPDAPLWKLGRSLRRWQAELSEGYDLFAVSTHGVPPFCHAGRGLLYVHFPNTDRRAVWPWTARGGPRTRLHQWAHERHWRRRFAGYGVTLANSRFTADWVRAYWGAACGVLHPPVTVDVPAGPKRDVIAALGRFTPFKRQLDLVRAFRETVSPRLPGWELVCLGTVGATDAAYFREVQAAAGGAVRLVTDAPATEVRRVLGGARVFWHAAGFGVDPHAEPHRLEHFGIATVEAMAAGCVPVVPDLGGQREIVRPGEDGFLCGSVGELADVTVKLAADGVILAKLSAAARDRARAFGRERFVEQLRRLV
jgi:glycosyltransferase involved in cell wall biosynthesis